ncbi:MAG TPA: 2Fe-2S iron-sulfur cluster binding domain-containing protein [Lutibacter sp.]|nr:2Fe-2S iron-sulfur cluster binding domain-containing protein [Lutibacter sp.]
MTKATKQTEACSITLIINGEQATINATKTQTIIEAAEEADIKAPHACKKGLCTKCMATLSDGEVVMEETEKLSEEQVAEGKILTCISRPTTNTIVVNYDI